MLEVKDLSLKIDEHLIFENLSFGVESGKLMLIKGMSGSGKSSLLQVINQIIPNVLDGEVSGSVLIDGKEINGMKLPDLATSLGYMMQDPETQLCTFNVEDELLFGMENLRWSTEKMDERLNFVLDLFKLHELRYRDLSSLSGGQKQKVAFASIAAIDPDLYLLDEPTANLDPITTKEILNIVDMLVNEYGKTVVLIEHKIEEVLNIVDKVFEIESNSTYTEDIEGILHEYIKSYQLPVNKADFSEEIILEANNINFFYGNKQILFDLNMNLHKGEIIGLVGRNGAGKSTFSNILSGLRKSYTGDVLIHGENTRNFNATELGKKIGLVFQNPEHQFVKYTVEEELAVGLEVRNIDPDIISREVDKYLELFKLTDKRHNNPYQLSQGEKRKLSTAAMLITGQDVLILDEPTYGQDRDNLANLMDLLFEISGSGIGIIMISHSTEVIKNSCHSIIELEGGKIVYNGKASEYRSKSR